MPAGTSGAATGTDEYGYSWVDSYSLGETVTYDWKDITSTGADTLLKGDDVSGGPFPIGFEFEFYGIPYSEFYVSTNGLVTFGSGSDESQDEFIPSLRAPNALIAAFWDDLKAEYGTYWTGYILYETLGSAPSRQLVVEFFQVERVEVYEPLNFEVVLNETGEIWLQYETVGGVAGESATVGIENAMGTIGTMYSRDWAVILDGLAVMFSLAPVVIGADQKDSGPLGGMVPFPMNVANNQDFEDSVDIAVSTQQGWAVELLDHTMSPLADTNSNGLPDTGTLPAWTSALIHVQVTVPLAPAGPVERVNLTASSYADPANLDPAFLVVTAALADFDGPYTDMGVDLDGDSYYEFMDIGFSLNVYVEDTYRIEADLYDVGRSHVTDLVVTTPPLSEGVCAYAITFPGPEIHAAQADGPYLVSLTIYDSALVYRGVAEYTTGPYSYPEFEEVEATSPPATTDLLEGLEGSGGWYTSDVLVSLFAEDPEDDLDATLWRIDGGSWVTYSAPFVVSGDGEHALEYYSVDIAGNEEAARAVSIRIDTSPPITDVSVSGEEGTYPWYVSAVTVLLSASDAPDGSGIAETLYSLDSGEWDIYEEDGIPVSGDGPHRVDFRSVDVASNEEYAVWHAFQIDTTAPDTASSVSGGTVTLSATDSTSGVDVTRYRIDGGNWTDYTGPFEVTGAGEHTVEYFTVDVAGNIEQVGDVSLTVEEDEGRALFGFDLTFWTVLMIIALLIMIAVPKLLGKGRAAKDAATKHVIKDIGTAVSQMADDNDMRPRERPAEEPKPPEGEGED